MWFAERASAAYQPATEIQQRFPQVVRVATPAGTDVQYFLERDDASKRQIISVRGTDNLTNVKEDADYLTSRNPRLGIFVHSGFDADTLALYQDIKPFLEPGYDTVVTGHSLGAAISTLLMLYLHEDGYRLLPSMNFGQPKVTNGAGAEKYDFLPLTRVVDENDVVPDLPPVDLLDSVHGRYEHFGREVVLLPGPFYAYLQQHQAMRESLDSFWDNIGEESVTEHYMVHYLAHIRPKLQREQQINYNDRERYLKPAP
nr:lipase family protein [Pseudomaricurvus sp. HS19]